MMQSRNLLRFKNCVNPNFIYRKAHTVRTNKNSKLVVHHTNNTPTIFESAWVEVPDPKGTSQSYWWNKKTNETTALGATKPETWIEQRDPAGSSLTYWWNPETNITTALGELPPTVYSSPSSPIQFSSQPTTFGGLMMHSMVLGFGMSLAFAFVRVFIG